VKRMKVKEKLKTENWGMSASAKATYLPPISPKKAVEAVERELPHPNNGAMTYRRLPL